MTIIFLAYRDWALSVVRSIIKLHGDSVQYETLASPSALLEWQQRQCGDTASVVLMAIGWSWIIDAEVTQEFLCLGIHPSNLPDYRGGSPIQNQIIAGVVETQCSLFRIAAKLDAGEIWGKTALSLAGDSMDDIFNNIESASVRLLSAFIRDYPNIETVDQVLSRGTYSKRRKPEDSKLASSDFDFSDITTLYNKIRCLTAPYPNAYIEDDKGNRLYFEKILFTKPEAKP